MKFVLNWLINAAALWVATQIVPGVLVEGTESLFIAALIIGLVNSIIRPILAFLTFPITVITLGLFYFVLNGAMVYLAAGIAPGFEIESMLSAILAGLVMSVVATVLHLFVKPKKKRD